MIVELDGNALLALVNGDAVAIGDHIVRPGDRNRITERGAMKPEVAEHFRAKGSGRTGPHKIHARFAGRCYSQGCSITWIKGEPMIYDYDNRKAYCVAHGLARFPALGEEANA